ncbi:hypothetical protein DFS33DRAFT_891726 [Desarmillaria ectypa]|nr:hypothetical protein DFS33DRAFT_891726 [Desarmillaria ectypa]
MPMPSYQSVLEKERERDVQNQPDASPATTAQRRFPSQSRQPNGVPYMMPRQPMGTMGPSMGWQRQIQEQSFFLEIMRMPPRILDQVKEDLGLAGKELTAMTFDEKWRLVLALRQRSAARPTLRRSGYICGAFHARFHTKRG